MVEVRTQCSEGSLSYPDKPDTPTNLHSNVLVLEAIHIAMPHWLRKLKGLTVLVASAEHERYSCTRGYSSCVRTTR
jgi:hypothetical protein